MRQDATYFVADTNYLQPVFFLRHDLFPNDAVIDGMHNLQYFDLTVLNANDGTFVAGGLYGGRHTIEPVAWFNLGEQRSRGRRQQTDCENQPNNILSLAKMHYG